MLRYVVQKLIVAIPVVLLVSLLVFIAMQLVPGDPVAVLLGSTATPDRVAALQAKLGLDKPLYIQYLNWLWHALQGDLGESVTSRKSVNGLLLSAIPVTLQIIVVAQLFAIVVAIIFGVIAATYPGSWLDHAVTFIALLGLSVPSFWSGILLIILFSVTLRWLPPSGFVPLTESPLNFLKSLLMPSLSFGFFLAGPLTRFVRAELTSVLHQDYIRTAQGKGLQMYRVLVRHALPNALIPMVTMIGLQLGGTLTGAAIVEEIFALPGVGRLVIWAISNRDFPVIQGVVLYIATGYVIVNLAVDVTYALLNPRIRY